jgi:hypothetical protein
MLLVFYRFLGRSAPAIATASLILFSSHSVFHPSAIAASSSNSVRTDSVITDLTLTDSELSETVRAGDAIALSPPPAEVPPFPTAVAERVLRTASATFGIPQENLQIGRYSRETWPDSCLGLAGPTEACGTVIVEGWQFEVVKAIALPNVGFTERI